jgi:malate dehydrogenase
MRTRVGIIGAGHVGAEIACGVITAGVADCVLLDVNSDLARAKALDLQHRAAARGSSACAQHARGYEDLRDCAVLVLAAGVPRGPGMTRDQLLGRNLGIVQSVMEGLRGIAPQAPLLVVTNPLDAMAYAAWKLGDREARSVIGLAGELDAARFRAFLARELDVSCEDVQAIVLGSHGDLMVPLWTHASVGGLRAVDFASPEAIQRVVARTKQAGTELVELLRTGSAWFAAGAAGAAAVQAVLDDSRRVMACSVLCRGEYGIRDVFVGVPVVIGARGAHHVIEVPLSPAERGALDAAAGHLASMQALVDELLMRD